MPFSQRASKGKAIAPEKAKQILKDDSAQGHPLTSKQKGFFGARAGGAPMPAAMPAAKNPPGRKGRR